MKTLSIRNILVPIDFSALSIAAIDTAAHLARRFGATVHLAHSHEFLYPAGFAAPPSPDLPYPVLTYDQQSETRAGKTLIQIAKRAGLSGATTHVLVGSPAFDEICRLANDLPADLIVMSTHGRSGLKNVLMGSTAERIVQHSPCPVYVTRQSSRGARNGAAAGINKILVPIDFSRCSLGGLKYVIGFAQKTGAKVILFHAVAYRYTTNGWVTYELTEATRAAEEEAARQMQKLVRATKFGAIAFETAIVSGNAVDKICDYARRQDVDLIITSTHGRTGLKHMLMGSVAENVVRHAPCSVMSVPSFPKARSTKIPNRGSTSLRRSKQRGNLKPTRCLIEREKLTRKFTKLTAHPFPERRKTNRFRETHLLQ